MRLGRREAPEDNAEPVTAIQDLATTAVLFEPLFEDLLAQQVTDFEYIDVSISMDAEQGLYWPTTNYNGQQEAMY